MKLEKEKFISLIEGSISKFTLTLQNSKSEDRDINYLPNTQIDLTYNVKIVISYGNIKFTIERLKSNDKDFIVKTNIKHITLDFKLSDIEFEDLSILIQKEFEKRQTEYQNRVIVEQQAMLERWENEVLNKKK